MEEKKPVSKGFAITALIMGILAIVNSFIPFLNVVSYIFAILAIIFGIIGIVKKGGKAMAIVGLVLGGVSLILATAINNGTSQAIDEAVNGGSSNTPSANQTKTIEYTAVSIDEMEEALENNAAAAKDTYKGKYLEITGRLGTIDSDLKYISLLSPTDNWDLIGVHCTLKNQTVKDVVKTLSKDQTIIVRGKVTDVGEVLGYYLDTYEIIIQ